jgi:oligosaccharide repeat unit polymerase
MVGVTGAVVRVTGLWSLQSFAALVFSAGFGVRALILDTSKPFAVFDYVRITPTEADNLAVASLIVLLVMVAGMAAPALLPARGTTTVVESSELRRWSPRAVLIGAAVVILIQVALMARTFGGLGAAVTALSRRTLTGESLGLAASLTFAAVPLLLFAIATARRYGSKRIYRLSIAVFLSSMPWLTLVNGRAIAIVALWALALTLRLEGKRPPSGLATGVGVIAIVAVSIVGLAWRNSAQTSASFAESLTAVRGDSVQIVSGSLPLFDEVFVAKFYEEHYGQDSGLSLPAAFTVLVPRTVWSDKPEFMPQLVGERVGRSDLSGLPVGLVGEGFIAFGWIGVGLYAFAFGALVSLAQRLLATTRRLTPVGVWLLFLMSSIVLGGLRTGGQGALIAAQLAILVLPIVLACCWLATKRVVWGAHPSNRSANLASAHDPGETGGASAGADQIRPPVWAGAGRRA